MRSSPPSSGRAIRKLLIAVETLDLGRVFPVGLAALSVLGETAHIWETQLGRDVGGSPRGYVPDIRQEPAEGANGAELYGVPQAVGVTPSPINVTSVLVVKEEVALELSLFNLANVATVRGGRVVVEEVYRHPAMVSNSRSLPLSVRFRSIVPQPPSSRSGKLSDRAMDPVTMYRLIQNYLGRLPGAIQEVQSPDGIVRRKCIYSPHSLRATTATLTLDAKVDIRKVQELLGHRHITTTQGYDKRRRSTSESASHDVPI